jgi:hypothetical protein
MCVVLGEATVHRSEALTIYRFILVVVARMTLKQTMAYPMIPVLIINW